MLDISERKREILYAVVEDFISTAEPVGSVQVSRRKGIAFSPATIRHVMSELEELGFLKQPHTSAGRVPTDLAFRFYVDELLHIRPLSSNDRDEIRTRVEAGATGSQEILRDACKLISTKSNQAGLMVAPSPEERSLKHIQFLSLKQNVVLAILVTTTGIVENKILELKFPVTQSDLNRMHNFLNERLAGLTISEVRRQILLEMKGAQSQVDALITRALFLGQQATADPHRDVHIEGQSRLLSGPEFTDLEHMKQILRTLEEKSSLLQMLEEALRSPGVKIYIGEEIPSRDVGGLTLITSAYSDADGNRGLLGVIGPTRMNYARVIPLVEFTSGAVTEALQEPKS